MKGMSGSLGAVASVSLARVIGLGLALTIGVISAGLFGTGAAKDCYLVAQMAPGFLTTFLVGGAYSSLMVLLMEIRRAGDLVGQVRLTRTVLVDVLLAVAIPVALALVAPRAIVQLLAPGLPAEHVELSASLLRLTIVAVPCVVALALTRCLFEINMRFGVTSTLGLVTPVVSLVTLAAGAGSLGIYALALGPVLGSCLTWALLTALRARVLGDPITVPASGGPEALTQGACRRRFWRSLIPLSLGANYGQINLLVDNAFASYLPTGNIAALGFAFVLVSNTELLTTLSLAEVNFARLASSTQREPHQLADAIRWGQRHMLLVTAPLAVGFVSFGGPVVRLLFERGQFEAAATRAVSLLLACYSLKILFMGILAIDSQLLLVRGRVTRLTVAAMTAIAANAALNALLMPRLGVEGIALATTMATFLHVVIIARLARAEIDATQPRGSGFFGARVIACAVLMGIGTAVWAWGFERTLGCSTEILRAIEVGGGLLLAFGLYTGLLHLARVDEGRALFRRLVREFPPAVRG
jgi:putative peptidoglycan lipid II flippase